MADPERGGEAAIDLATIHADDALLEAVSRGRRPVDPAPPDGEDDALAGLLAQWHDDLSADVPGFDFAALSAATEALPAATLSATVPDDRPDDLPDLPELRPAEQPTERLDVLRAPAAGDGSGPTERLDVLRDPAPGDRPDPAEVPVLAARRRRGGSGLRRAFTAVAAGIVLLGGLAVGAQHSGPDGPLWPLTEVLYPETAHARAAEQAVAEAADAIAAARWGDARRLLDTATTEANQVDNAGTRGRLLDRIADLRAQLPPPAPPSAAPSPAAPPPTTEAAPTDPATPAPTPGATTPGGDPGGGGGATRTPGGGNGQIIPGLPTQIVPTGPGLPLPTQILPSVPGLPLPTL